jgi:hypothetical protein
MDFSREVAKKYLAKHMFRNIKPAAAKTKAIENVLNRLSSVDVFKVHGRMIDGNAAKTELGLNVHLLGKGDPLWKALWHYYVRADVSLSRHGAAKLIESRAEVLIKARTIVAG